MVAVLVSGGIDSMIAAYLLKQKHPRVFGIYLKMGYNDLSAESVRTISERVGMPVETVDCRREFKTAVIEYFANAYLKGETPNPCLHCNPRVKFGIGLDYALEHGADFVASGHYCRVRQDPQGARLMSGLDRRKDQSYFLSLLTPAQLGRVRFPVGDMTKAAVSALAREKGLIPVQAKESQDVCFIEKDATYADFISQRKQLPPQPGLIEDVNGEVIGEHHGVHLFTVGQRRGINCPAARPYYVVRIDVERNRIIVGFREALSATRCLVREVNWIDEAPDKALTCLVKVRYQHVPAEATISPLPGGNVSVAFKSPQFGVAPGQGAVFYQGDLVLGGGIITG